MSEKKFKVGDRVRVMRDCKCGPFETLVKEGSEGEVCDIDHGYRDVDMDGLDDTVWVHVSNLELAPPSDPCTAFLQDLKSVLERHNATIFGLDLWAKINGETFDFGDTEYLSADNITNHE